MPLQAGTRFGGYEVIGLIGSGGMGEVWLATERRLGRKVALKLLPADLTRDPARVVRFEQEARAASALNHANVCTIYALGEAGEGQHYIAMEYVEGETLRRRLATSQLSVREALDIAIQVAAALSVAHAAGIVHRDIKPENVMLRPDGVVKVLDFGLAKLAGAVPDGADTTRMGVNTDAGTVVGTAAYMSPEQARGQQVDARTDIWSLGVMLYEMVAGRSPFAGPSGSDVLAAILQNEPAPVARFDPEAPAEVQRILTKTLRKDRSQRYQTVQDLLLDLQALREDFPSHARFGSGPTILNPTEKEAIAIKGSPRVGRSTRRIVLAAAAVLIVAGGALGSWWWFTGRGPEAVVNSPPIRHNLTRLTFGAGLQTDATWSPDGRSIAYTSDQAGNNDIWVQSLSGGDPVQLTRSPTQDTAPSWSPDGRRIVFRSERDGGGLFVVPALGGAERQLTSVGVRPEWTPDGSEILFRTGGGILVSLHTVRADGGEPAREILREFLRGGSWYWIASHPDGRISALGIHGQSGAGFYTVSRDGRNVTRSELAQGLPLPLEVGSMSGQGTRVERFVWNRTGTALYVEAVVNEVRNVWRVRVEPKTLQWQVAEQLTAGAGADEGAALSRDGTRLVFTTERKVSRLWVFPFDAAAGRVTGKGMPLTPEDDAIGASDLAPDGTKAAYIVRRPGSQSVDLWAVDVTSGQRELLAQNVITPRWSPDSKAIAYSLIRPDPPGEWAVAVRALSGPERLLSRWSRDSALLVSDWTRDGTAILGSYLHPISSAAPLALWSSSTQSLKPQQILLADPPRNLWQGRFSPNGRWVSFVVEGRAALGVELELMVAPAGGAPPADWTRIAADHVFPDKPRWAPDGRSLYFLSRHSGAFFNLWGVRFDPNGGRPVGAPFMITRFDSAAQMISPEVGETETGISARHAMLTMATVTGNIWMLDNVDK